MANLPIQQISSKAFTHCAAKRSLTSEISDLGIHRFSRLYDDACDEGFALVNEKTGNKTVWSVQNEIRDGEFELSGWVLKPTWESIRKNPALADYSMTIFND